MRMRWAGIVGLFVLAGIFFPRVSQTRPAVPGGAAFAAARAGCSIRSGPRTVAVSANATALSANPASQQACTGDSVNFSPSGPGTYTVKFNSDADPFGWGGQAQTLPVTGTVTATGPIGAPGFKYTVTCVSGCNAAVSPLDPHIVVM